MAWPQGYGGNCPTHFSVKVVGEISLQSKRKQVGGGISKSSETFWKMIDQHQYQQVLCIVKKGAGVLSVRWNHWSLVCRS